MPSSNILQRLIQYLTEEPITPPTKTLRRGGTVQRWPFEIGGPVERYADGGQVQSTPPEVLRSVAKVESNWNPSARSPVGALGLMQFMPGTAKDMGIDPLDPIASLWGADEYLQQLYGQFGNWPDALAAYNWGPARVKKYGRGKAPAETKSYVERIMTLAQMPPQEQSLVRGPLNPADPVPPKEMKNLKGAQVSSPAMVGAGMNLSTRQLPQPSQLPAPPMESSLLAEVEALVRDPMSMAKKGA